MAGTATDGDDDLIDSINVTPLVDVMLVLLIIFMVTASYIVEPAIPVELPKAVTSEETVQTTLALVLTKDGKLFLNGEEATEELLRAKVKEELVKHPDVQAIIAADKDVSHGAVVHLIDVIKLSGVVKFALNTKYEDAPAR
ncbi:MAG: biopolymer transporter ExbD [Myxococcota bacterium]|jgi:biopolymer transport protein ExbD|nr:biopolymer transporter ExbD [Myxococcota bacterium]